VVGVLHTHYSGYAADLPGGFINKAAVGLVCRVVCRLHCHKVVQLSELARGMSRSTVVNVHGVSAKFLRVGQHQAHRLWKQQQQQQHQQQQQQQQGPSRLVASDPGSCFSKGCYFLGKALWDKGHGELMDLLMEHGKNYGQVPVDVFGVGPDLAAIQTEAERRRLPLIFRGQVDHCSAQLQEYKVFINCCKKDVLATATAEAVAMNKWVLLPDVACNQFFKAFPNVLIFKGKKSFSQQLLRALEHDPPALSDTHLRNLSWAAATERLMSAASIAAHEWPGVLSQAWDDCLWVPYRFFALMFKGARGMFAAAPKLLPEVNQQQEQQQQHGQQRLQDLHKQQPLPKQQAVVQQQLEGVKMLSAVVQQ
jgi:digalactosyldiacylglycerol synthase